MRSVVPEHGMSIGIASMLTRNSKLYSHTTCRGYADRSGHVITSFPTMVRSMWSLCPPLGYRRGHETTNYGIFNSCRGDARSGFYLNRREFTSSSTLLAMPQPTPDSASNPTLPSHPDQEMKRRTEAEKVASAKLQTTDHNHEDLANEHDHSHSHEEHGHSHEGSMFGHSHSHSRPNELLQTSASSFMSNPAVRITWIGLFTNIAIAVSKGLGGVYFHSQALIADAIHSVSDMVADFLTLATVNVAHKIGTPTRFPLGYGKMESVGSFLVSGVLLFAGISVGWSSLLQILGNVLPPALFEYASMIQLGHSHSHSVGAVPKSLGHAHSHSLEPGHIETNVAPTTPEIPNINGAWLAAASIVVKELLFRKTLKVAKQTNSKVLIANAWHHRVDSLTSTVALVTITGGVLFNIAWLDSIGGLLVSVLIIKAGWGSFRNAWYELVDRGESKDSEVYGKIQSIINTDLQSEASIGGLELTELSVLSSGANTNVVAVISVAKDASLQYARVNAMEQKLKASIRADDKFVKNIFIEFQQKTEA